MASVNIPRTPARFRPAISGERFKFRQSPNKAEFRGR